MAYYIDRLSERRTGKKLCTKCGRRYPNTAEYFDKNKQSSDGLHYYCKACRKAERESEKRRKKSDNKIEA